MPENKRLKLIETIIRNEKLRPLSRLARLLKDPLNALPYYFLASFARIKPFSITFKTLWGTKMTCYLPEGNTFYYYGYCEANLTNFFIRFIKPGMTVIDVGSHVGIYSMLGSELVGENGKVFSFEPTPWTFKLLQKNTDKLNNVTIFNQAISESERTLTFSDYGPGYGAYNSANNTSTTSTSKTAAKINVASISLTNFCQANTIHPNFIKIDSEGYEYEVLLGSKELLSVGAYPRPLISIEVAGGTAWADNSKQAFSLLNTLSYLPYEITNDGLLSPHLFKDSYTYDNLIFIPQERLTELNELLK